MFKTQVVEGDHADKDKGEWKDISTDLLVEAHGRELDDSREQFGEIRTKVT